MLTVLLILASVPLVWVYSLTVAWAINRRELKRLFGAAPFNWRIYGWWWIYVPYLQSLKQKRENN